MEAPSENHTIFILKNQLMESIRNSEKGFRPNGETHIYRSNELGEVVDHKSIIRMTQHIFSNAVSALVNEILNERHLNKNCLAAYEETCLEFLWEKYHELIQDFSTNSGKPKIYIDVLKEIMQLGSNAISNTMPLTWYQNVPTPDSTDSINEC